MSADQTPADSQVSEPAETGLPGDTGPRVTRASAAWVATGAALVLLVLLIMFILQNSTDVDVHYLGFAGSIPLGMALLIAAVGGGVVVAIAGTARVTQLRLRLHQIRHPKPDA